MKRMLFLVVGLFVVAVTGVAQGQATFNNYHANYRYDFEVGGEPLAQSPAWSEEQDCPPLSARAAIKAAKAQMQKLFNDGDKWTNRSFEITRVGDRWVYLIKFDEPVPPGVLEHLSSPFRIPVLMNGDTIEPRVSQWPQRQ